MVQGWIAEEVSKEDAFVPVRCAACNLDHHIHPKTGKRLGKKQPSLEFATPEQIAGAALFLCSEAATQVRGIALPVDGGWTAQ
jgi:NAD(P)-dependent dehydrogenase (short-subunit alcohol dehydrogenase family)